MGDHGPDCLCDACLRDAPKCPACGVAWHDHPGPTNMCEQIQRLRALAQSQSESLLLWIEKFHCTDAKADGRAATIRRLLEEIERLRSERDALKAACHRNKRKWKYGWAKTLEQIVRGWQRACNEKDAEIERLRSRKSPTELAREYSRDTR